jgi:tetratricopeptide (TPR) repeat protein
LTVDRAQRLAFSGRLAAAEAALRRSRSARSPNGRWISSYIAASRGAFSRAERTTRSLIASGATNEEVRARAVITLGSVLRQTARHAEARRVEGRWLERTGSSEWRAHLLIGLAADAVGLGDLGAVDAALSRVGSRPAGGWRTAVRLRWVWCERELLAGRPQVAVRHARRALAIAERAGARRHVAKSSLFLGAALREAGAHPEADVALRRARTIAAAIGARPIEGIARDMLGR